MNRRSSILLYLVSLCLETKSQTNLVYNSDFEIYSSCPVNLSDVTQAPNFEITKCIGWNIPGYGTSDYFNMCATNSIIGVPTNIFGYQQAYYSHGYVGCYFANYNGGSGIDGYNGIMAWEYIQGQFIQALNANEKYRVSMYISLAENSDLCIKEFGAFISQNLLTSPNTAALPVNPQLKFINSSYFRDTINWVKVSAEYIATGGEKYIIIGNFKDNLSTDTLRLAWADPPKRQAYYYIDRVEVSLIEETQEIPTIFTPNGDGVNDLWKLPEGFMNGEIYIYNRWGDETLRAPTGKFAWDGKLRNGSECPDGIYFYIIQNKDDNGNQQRGFFLLKR